ncbi:MAG TPA: hypothetical protein VNW97_20035 [Candidatus Saccharimonadales bacterium]|nr:hypothetical protein [Candidatus Saccharimonadales bacterium]
MFLGQTVGVLQTSKDDKGERERAIREGPLLSFRQHCDSTFHVEQIHLGKKVLKGKITAHRLATTATPPDPGFKP